MNAHEVLTIDAARPDTATADKLGRIQRNALIAGVVGTVLLLISFIQGPGAFFQSYLLGYLVVAGLAIGCVPLIMLHYLISGEWGALLLRYLEAGARTLPLIAVLFIPVLIGLPYTHIWSNHHAMEAFPELAHLVHLKTLYLNVPFFIVRAIIYFAVWIGLAYALSAWSKRLDETGDPRYTVRMWRLSGAGMVAFVLTVTFAAVDWIMSLNPAWFSGIFGAMIGVGMAFEAFLFTVIVVILLSKTAPMSRIISRKLIGDLGNLTLAFTMVWTYLQLSQLIIIWSANLPEETPWYLVRVDGGWRVLAVMLGLFHFALPFLLLLNGEIRRSSRAMLGIAILLIVMRFIDMYWMVMPPFSTFYSSEAHWGRGIAVHWQDFVAPVAIGGFWLAYYVYQLKKKPLLPVRNPNLPEVREHA